MPGTAVASKFGPRIPFFQFARDCCGFHYLDGSTLNHDMCEFYERGVHAWFSTRYALRKRVKLMFLIPRKGRKSTCITQAGPAYLLLHDPNMSVVIDSEKKERANDFLATTGRIMAGEATRAICPDGCTLPERSWKKLFGSWRGGDRDQQWRADRLFINTRTHMQRREPSLVSSSVEIGYTGGAPDAIGIDDPMSPESHNDSWMAQVQKHYDGLGPVLMPNGLFWLCMTRYDDADLAGHIERTEGWHTCEALEMESCLMSGHCTKATREHPEPWHVLYRQALDDSDRSIDDVVWPTEMLLTERSKNPTFFSGQFMNDPWQNPDAAYQKEDFVYADAAPPDTVTILSTDTAWKDSKKGKTERGGDWNVFITGRHQHSTGRVYITEVQRGKWTMGEWGDELVKVLRRHRESRWPVSRMTYEDISAAKGAIKEAVRSACARWSEVAPALFEIQRSRQDEAKMSRIKTMAQYFQNHQAIFVRPCGNVTYDHDCIRCAPMQVLRSELLKLGATMYDDCADAMADHFHPTIYTAPPAYVKLAEPPAPLRPFDDILKPSYSEREESMLVLDEEDRPRWIQRDAWEGREPV